MISALSTAHDAFKLSSDTLQAVGATVPNQPKKSHPFLDYWPVIAAGAATLIATVNAVALGILGNIAFCIPVAIGAAISAPLIIYLWKFSTIRDLSTYVKAFSEHVAALANSLLRFRDENKTLHASTQSLDKSIKDREVEFEKEKKAYVTVKGDLDTTIQRLSASESQVLQLGKLLDGSHNIVSQITTEIGALVDLNKKDDATSEALESRLDAVKKLGGQLTSTITEVKEEGEMLSQKKQQAVEAATALHTQAVQIAGMLVQITEQSKQLTRGNQELKDNTDQLRETIETLQSSIKDLEKARKDAESAGASFSDFASIADLFDPPLANTASAHPPKTRREPSSSANVPRADSKTGLKKGKAKPNDPQPPASTSVPTADPHHP